MSCSAQCSRRAFLKTSGAALAALNLRSALSLAAAINDGGALAPRPGQIPARAKHLIIVFLTGGFSHLDTFDPKPKLAEWHGKTMADAGYEKNSKQTLLVSSFRF